MLLKVGSKGNDVKLLQEKLGLTADGSFGPKTEAAVNAWLTKNGLTADGTITSANKSWDLMFGTNLVKEDVIIQPTGGLNIPASYRIYAGLTVAAGGTNIAIAVSAFGGDY